MCIRDSAGTGYAYHQERKSNQGKNPADLQAALAAEIDAGLIAELQEVDNVEDNGGTASESA